MPKLRMTEYHLDSPARTWVKVADYFIESNGEASFKLAERLADEDPVAAQVVREPFEKREAPYSIRNEGDVPFSDGEAVLRAISNQRGTYVLYKWWNDDGGDADSESSATISI